MKQHYLPEVYLREFTNVHGKLHTLDINLRRNGREVFETQRYPVEVCRSKDFYTIKPTYLKANKDMVGLKPMFLESQFGLYESKYPKLLTKVKRGQRYLQREDSRLLIYTVFDFKLRNKYFRDTTITNLREQVFDQVADESKDLIQAYAQAGIPGVTEEILLAELAKAKERHIADPEFPDKTHIASLSKRKTSTDSLYDFIIDHLLQFEWLIIESDQGFITTDNPGVSVDKKGRVQNTKFDEDFFFIMPLTPSICIGISPTAPDKRYDPKCGKKHLTYGKAPEDFVALINQFHGYHLSQFIFANNKDLIENIAALINANPIKNKNV